MNHSTGDFDTFSLPMATSLTSQAMRLYMRNAGEVTHAPWHRHHQWQESCCKVTESKVGIYTIIGPNEPSAWLTFLIVT